MFKVQCGTLKNPQTIQKRVGCEVPDVVAVLCVVPSGGLVLHIAITSYAPFPLGQKCPRKMTMIARSQFIVY